MKVEPTPALMAMMVWWSYPICRSTGGGGEVMLAGRAAVCFHCTRGNPVLTLVYAWYRRAFEIAFGPGWTLWAQKEANGMHSIKVRSYEN